MKKLISTAVAALLASSLAVPSFADKGGVPNENASENAVGRDGEKGNKGGNGGGKGHDNDSPGHTNGEDGDGSGKGNGKGHNHGG